MKALPDLVQEESHVGRELVFCETHGALSTNLRLIEQRTREIRNVDSSLYELAVSANSRLRETLTLARTPVVPGTRRASWRPSQRSTVIF